MLDKKLSTIIITTVVIVLIVVLLIAALGFWKAYSQRKVEIDTDKGEYIEGSALKVNIKNNLREKICFSSCYPYYLEKKNNGVDGYDYSGCLTANLVEKCIEPAEIKGFKIILPDEIKGINRLAIPVCVGCALQEQFREDQRFYSNDFIIK